jgi:hypothetical protein
MSGETPIPQDAMPQPRPEKSEAEIAAQIGRISENLIQRAADLHARGVIRETATDTNDSDLHFKPRSNSLEFNKKSHQEDGTVAESSISISRANWKDSDGTDNVSHRVDKATHTRKGMRTGNHSDVVVKTLKEADKDDGELLLKRIGMSNGDKVFIDLTNEQVIKASAGILSQARSELSRRKSERNIEEAKADQAIDDILKA